MIRKLIVMEGKELSYSKVRKGDLNGSTDEFNKSIEKIKSKYKQYLTMFDDVSTLDEAMLEISRHKPDVVIDDYIQLISMPDVSERRFQIEKIVQDYKWICKKENCSALLVSQLNRDIEKRYEPRPRLSDYSESGVIEQTAESALFVWYGYVFNDEEYSPYQSEIISAKTRYGKVMTEEVGFNGDRCKFYKTKEEAIEDVIRK
jgi:replicative DNA helicase